LHVHSTLAVRPDGVTLGLLDQIYWARPQTGCSAPERKERPIEEKESYKWLLGIDAAEAAWESLPGDQRPRLIHVMDREGDVHEVMQRVTNSSHYAIIRCAQNRSVSGPINLAFAASEAAPLFATVTIDLPKSQHGKASTLPARRVTLELRKVQLTLCPDQDKQPTRRPASRQCTGACGRISHSLRSTMFWRHCVIMLCVGVWKIFT
jgi:hypothetical protein